MDEWRTEEVKNQTRFRDFNEWIKSSNGRMGNHRPHHEYICECSDASCRQPILLTDQEYEGIRSEGARFAIAVNHENPELDGVIAQNPRFTTIEKLPGEPQRIARLYDPRVIEEQEAL